LIHLTLSSCTVIKHFIIAAVLPYTQAASHKLLKLLDLRNVPRNDIRMKRI